MNEFLGKFTSLQRELLKSSERVATGLPMDILDRFNQVGGAFEARDPRSMGNINSIQESLSNPGSDNMRAAAFRVLSDQNPNAGIFDLRESMQKGLASPGYLKGMLGLIDRIGGDDQMKMNNLSGMFPGLPLSVVRRLYNNREGLEKGNLSVDELQAKFPVDFKGRAEANTNTLERNTASIQNGQLQDVFGSAEKMAEALSSAFKASLSGAVIQMNNGKLTLVNTPVQVPIRENITRKPTDAENHVAGIGGVQSDPYAHYDRKSSLSVDQQLRNAQQH